MVLNSNTWNNVTVCKQMSSNSFKIKFTYKLFAKKYICMYRHTEDLALNNDKGWYAIKPNNQPILQVRFVCYGTLLIILVFFIRIWTMIHNKRVSSVMKKARESNILKVVFHSVWYHM